MDGGGERGGIAKIQAVQIFNLSLERDCGDGDIGHFINSTGSDGLQAQQGMGVDYFDEIASYTGWQYEYIQGSRSELEQELAAGAIDFIVPVMQTAARADRLYDYPDRSIGTAASGLYVSERNDTIYYDDYEHMKGIRIGGTAGSFQMLAAREYAVRHGFSFTEVDFSGYQEALAALDAGQIDAVALSSLYKVQGYRLVATTKYAPFYAAADKNRRGRLLEKLNQAMYCRQGTRK